MLKKRPVLDHKACISCHMCVQACPVSCLTLDQPGKQGKYRNNFPRMTGENCIGCGLCAKTCPMQCITMEEAEA